MTEKSIGDGEMATEATDAAGVYRIWPGDGAAPGSEDWDWQESTMPLPWAETDRRLSRNVVVPTVTLFRPNPEARQRHSNRHCAGWRLPFPDDRP